MAGAPSPPRPARARFRLHALIGLIAGLALLLMAATLVGPAVQSALTYDVCPAWCRYATVQAAIDAAQPGAPIRIGPGEYTERLDLAKPVALIGTGVRKERIANGGILVLTSEVTIRPRGGIVISGGEGITVGIRGLLIDGSVTNDGPGCAGPPDACGHGVVIRGHARIELDEVGIRYYPKGAVWVRDEASAHLRNVTIANTRGVIASDLARVAIDFAHFEENDIGLRATDRSRVTISASVMIQIRVGIDAGGDARVDLVDSRVFIDGPTPDEGGVAIEVSERSAVSVTGGRVASYGEARRCRGQGSDALLCNAITISDAGQLTLAGTWLDSHYGWGVAARLAKCGYPADRFSGSVTVTAPTVIQDRMKDNLKGRGNPGDHPWATTQTRDGMACLP
jgi:hypothetical protein